MSEIKRASERVRVSKREIAERVCVCQRDERQKKEKERERQREKTITNQ